MFNHGDKYKQGKVSSIYVLVKKQIWEECAWYDPTESKKTIEWLKLCILK